MEYGTYIDDKMASGCREEEAVQGFGDVHEFGKEILEAYKIDANTVHTKIDRTLDKVYSRSESFLNKAGNLSME